MEDRARWSTARQQADSALVFVALRAKPWVWVHSWHATATRNSSLALGDNGFGPKRLDERLIPKISGMMATTLWSTALARDIGGSKIPAKCQGTNGRVLTRARARLLGEFPLRKHPRNPVFVDEEGYPHFDRTGLLLFLLRSRSSLAHTRDT
jgi:hypothetical protein